MLAAVAMVFSGLVLSGLFFSGSRGLGRPTPCCATSARWPLPRIRAALRSRGVSVVLCCQAEDGIRDLTVTGVQTCALPIFGGTGHLAGELLYHGRCENDACA